jgi:Fic family protein
MQYEGFRRIIIAFSLNSRRLYCLFTRQVLKSAEETLKRVHYKSRIWNKPKDTGLNSRQRLMLNKLLNGFNGELNKSKWASMAKCSAKTELRDIKDLIETGILKQEDAGGRSTIFELK